MGSDKLQGRSAFTPMEHRKPDDLPVEAGCSFKLSIKSFCRQRRTCDQHILYGARVDQQAAIGRCVSEVGSLQVRNDVLASAMIVRGI